MACQALLYWMAQNNRLAFHCAVAAAAMVAGCDTIKTTNSSTGSGTVAVQFDRAEFERQRDEYRRNAERQIASWEVKLEELNRKAEQATGEAKVRMERELAEQRVNLDRAKQELKEIDAVVGERWGEFQRRSSAAFDELKLGFERAVDRLQDDRD